MHTFRGGFRELLPSSGLRGNHYISKYILRIPKCKFRGEGCRFADAVDENDLSSSSSVHNYFVRVSTPACTVGISRGLKHATMVRRHSLLHQRMTWRYYDICCCIDTLYRRVVRIQQRQPAQRSRQPAENTFFTTSRYLRVSTASLSYISRGYFTAVDEGKGWFNPSRDEKPKGK